MLKTYEAMPTVNKVAQRVLVTFTQDTAQRDTALGGAILSEMALAEDGSRNEDAAAWAHLQALCSDPDR